jgi:amidohydrolase
MIDFYSEAQDLFEMTRMLRRDFHRHPELGFHEVRTAGIVARELSQLGLEVTSGIAETGVVALLEGARPGPVVLLRFDMDALPVTEENKTDYVSQTPGVMHACGHDGHVAIGITVARMLNEIRNDLPGTIKFIFQPAEEGQGGAERMIEAGIMQNPAPVKTLALHLWNEMPVGHVAFVPGPLMAGAELFSIKLTGRGGHGAQPNLTVDPIIAAAHIVTGLQTIVSRNIPPLLGAVLSVTYIKAGETYNVIPQTAELRGTLRYFEPEVKRILLSRFEQIITSVAQAFECQAEIKLTDLTPPVVNDADLALRLGSMAKAVLPEVVVDSNFKIMVSEDMALMMEKVPGCYFLVGSANAEKGLNYGHHHPRFDFDESALPRAAALMAAAAVNVLESNI